MTLMEPVSRPAFDASGFVTPDDPELDVEDDGPDGLEEATASVLAAIAARVAENARPPRHGYTDDLVAVDDSEIAVTAVEPSTSEAPVDDFAAGIVDDSPPLKFIIANQESDTTEENIESDASDDAGSNLPRSRRRRRRKSGSKSDSPGAGNTIVQPSADSPIKTAPSADVEGNLPDPASGKEKTRRRSRRRGGRRGGGASPESTTPADDLPSN